MGEYPSCFFIINQSIPPYKWRMYYHKVAEQWFFVEREMTRCVMT
ncbi:hypothetical protein ACFOGG_15160 [Brenneria rubrifaciens]